MAEFIKTQNSFAHGAVDTEFYARDNINGLSCLESMDVLPGGGLSRRAGLRSVADLPGVARLVTFSVSNPFKSNIVKLEQPPLNIDCIVVTFDVFQSLTSSVIKL